MGTYTRQHKLLVYTARITMRTVFIIAAICIAYAAAETAVEQEDVVPETSLAQSEESYGFIKKHVQRIRFSVCRYRAKKCHKHVAKSTNHGKAAHKHHHKARAHARASHHHSRKAKYHHKKAGRWWHFWKRAHRRAAKIAAARAKAHKRAAHAHAKKSKAHAKVAMKHGAKARAHGRISKKLMAYIHSKHKKCGAAFMKCMGRGKVKRRRHHKTRRL